MLTIGNALLFLWHQSLVAYGLMVALIERCEAGPWRQMVAAIGDSANKASITLHQRHGFEMIGTFKKVGYKFDRWLDSVLMQRPLGEDSPVIPKS